MSQHEENIDALIAAQLCGEATPEELETLMAWRKSSAHNEALYQQSLRTFETLNARAFEPDVERAWLKINQRINAKESKVIPLFGPRLLWRSAAAVAALLIGAYLVYFYIGYGNNKVELATVHETKEQVLPDGSKVFVNRHSTLTYKENKTGNREVVLEGEAFFEVSPHSSQHFVVRAGDLSIRDIGTAFNVKSVRGSDTTFVFVESGLVELSTEGDKTLRLGKGESGGFSKKQQSFFRLASLTAVNAVSYRTRIFSFKNESLANVLRQINDVYQSQVTLADDDLGQCRISVSFNNEPLSVIVDVIAETLDLSKVRQGDTLILTGNGCVPQ